MNTNSKSEEGRTAPTCSRTTTNAIKKARRDLDKYDREQRRKLMAEHGIQMMHKVNDLEEECLRATGHAYYDRPLCMSVRLSRLPGKPSVIRECRWCHAVDFDENVKGDLRRSDGEVSSPNEADDANAKNQPPEPEASGPPSCSPSRQFYTVGENKYRKGQYQPQESERSESQLISLSQGYLDWFPLTLSFDKPYDLQASTKNSDQKTQCKRLHIESQTHLMYLLGFWRHSDEYIPPPCDGHDDRLTNFHEWLGNRLVPCESSVTGWEFSEQND